ncbi:ATP-binding protein [Paucibacter soli]|uniref:ATP-binding protein n=1 Tax=Paucibacter soli TaxID=3133433 RepID=UPI0030AAB985
MTAESAQDQEQELNNGIAAQVQLEQLTSLYELTLAPTSLGVLFSIVPLLLLWDHLPQGLLLSWFAARALVAALRCSDVLSFRYARPGPDQIEPWRQRYLTLLSLDALSWGAMGWYFHTPAIPELDGIMLSTIVGLGAIGLFSLGGVLWAHLLFCGILFAPLALYLGLQNSPAGWFSLLGLGLFLGVSLFESRRSQARHAGLLRLRFENAHIAEQRRQALQSAEHSSTSKSRFVAVMSHEIRTPLNGILGMTQLLERSKLDAQQREQVDIVRRSGRHLLTLVNDILDLARIESGKLVVEAHALELAEAVDDVCRLLAQTAKEKGLAFDCRLAPGLPRLIMGDAPRIKQVLHNLIGNAIKFTERGSVSVEVSTVLDMRAGTLLHVAVRDTGAGIPADQMERVFAPFEQADNTRPRQHEGSGLGLTISRELARAMGGDLRCASLPGQGSVFEFTLPLRAGPMAPVPPAPPPLAGSLPLPALRGRVLLVDDSAVNLLVASTMLERCGLTVDQAENGREALQRMQATAYDLVLMDCQMPGMNGFEATQAWRQHEAREALATRTPIVALTASAVNSDRQRCLECGMDDYLVKPFEMDDLTTLVQRYLPEPGAARTEFAPA